MTSRWQITVAADGPSITLTLTPAPEAPAPEAPAPEASGGACCRATLTSLEGVLSDWERDAKSNHESMDHRHESMGGECYRTFASDDFRTMIEDVRSSLP